MIEKLVYVASQFPGEKLVREITNKFDGGDTHLNRWVWSFQITNLALLLHLLDKHLQDSGEVDDLRGLIKRELLESGGGVQSRVGDLVVEEEELRYLATQDLDRDSQTDINRLARTMLDYRLPRLHQALEETLHHQALESLHPDHGMMTYLVHEFLKQVKGCEPTEGESLPLVTALEGLFEEYYRHIEGQIEEYFR